MRVGLFVTCLVDLMRPSIGFAALRLLEAAGCEVVVPAGQTCCGQPGYNSGDSAAARALALKLLKEFEELRLYRRALRFLRRHDTRTLPGAVCQDDPAVLESVKRLSGRTYELTDFLVNVVKIENIPGRYSGTLTYHDSCAGLRELGVQAQPRALLAKMPGVTTRRNE